MHVPGHIFSFIESKSLKIKSHVPSTVGHGKEVLISTLESYRAVRLRGRSR